MTAGAPCPVVDLSRHVRLWVGPNPIPQRHYARWLRLLCLDLNATLTVITDSASLPSVTAREQQTEELYQFASLFAGGVVQVRELRELLKAEDDDEAVLVQHIKDELDASIDARINGDITRAGNMSVVADQARLLRCVQRLGAFADCDVLFMTALPTFPVATPSGVVARYKAHGTLLSNDFLAASSEAIEGRDDVRGNILCAARREVADMIRLYRRAALAASPAALMRLRNTDVHGASRFSFCGGPHAFAIAAFRCGVETGYESLIHADPEIEEEAEELHSAAGSSAAERAADDNAGGKLLTQMAVCPETGAVQYRVFHAAKPSNDSSFKWRKSDVFAKCIDGTVFAAWDHSWTDDQAWKQLTANETLRLQIAPMVFHAVGAQYFRESLLVVENHLTMLPTRNSVSLSTVLLESLLRPIINGARRLDFEKLPAETQEYIKHCETPSQEYREAVVARVAESDRAAFDIATDTMSRNGVVVLHQALTDACLAAYQAAFSLEVSKKALHPDLKQVSFNCAVDEDADEAFLACSIAIANSAVVRDLVEHYVGHPVKLTGLRGYRTEPLSPIAYRAWDYHQDLKSRGPHGEVKVMVLLTDVGVDGQAMRYAEGSARSHWLVSSMRDTKYSYAEAQAFANAPDSVALCCGEAGSLIVFDTNGIHSGHRNLSSRRDVVTLSFAADVPHHAVMFSERMCQLMESFVASTRVQEGSCDSAAVRTWRDIRVAPASRGDPNALRAEYELATANAVRQACDASWDVATGVVEPDWVVTLIQRDLHGDLDLRMGVSPSDDKARDNYLVLLRDCDSSHPRFHCIREHVGDANAQACSVENLQAALRGEGPEPGFTFRVQLADALDRVDSVPRLRTLLAFAVCALADGAAVEGEAKEQQQLSLLIALQLYRRILACCHSAVVPVTVSGSA